MDRLETAGVCIRVAVHLDVPTKKTREAVRVSEVKTAGIGWGGLVPRQNSGVSASRTRTESARQTVGNFRIILWAVKQRWACKLGLFSRAAARRSKFLAPPSQASLGRPPWQPLSNNPILHSCSTPTVQLCPAQRARASPTSLAHYPLHSAPSPPLPRASTSSPFLHLTAA